MLLGAPRQLQLLPRGIAGEFCERKRDGAEIAHKPAIVSRQPQKRTELAYVRGCWPVAHRLNLVLHDAQAVLANHVPEELNLPLAQCTFAGLGVQPLLTQTSQHLSDMLLVLLCCVAVHDDVIQEHQDELVEEVAERVVHQLHEHTGGVAQAHWQHVVLEQSL